MNVSELDYDLPDALIAQEPVEPRSSARLLRLSEETPQHHRVHDLPSLLPPSLLVVNDTRVLPARLFGRKTESGGKVELLLLERLGAAGEVERWEAMGRASKPIREGATLTLAGGLEAIVLEKRAGTLVVEVRAEGGVEAAMGRGGHVPLPPYIRREARASDEARYQTVFAEHAGAVAAPTAGLHFDEPLMEALAAAGHQLARVTLHVGPGTFRPVSVADLDEHPMHSERYAVSKAAAESINDAKRAGRPVVAIGTTVVRTLESAHIDGVVQASEGRTDLFIQPGFRFRVIDGLMTNFHLPRSTLLALVMALAGEERTRAAYREAVASEYRFYSYGDAMLIPPPRSEVRS
ncbi:MAG: tRNA preQ1(34) S-adenosylmethionine ribosyltransferase-isomerase QueA [Sandaracinaceae bacterium]